MKGDDASAVKALCDCIMDLRKWMTRHRLMLYDDKTEFLLLGTKQQLANVDINSITVGECCEHKAGCQESRFLV